MPSQNQRPLFTLRTNEIVGRSIELGKLQQAIKDIQQPNQHTLFFYIAGDGGMGKTRLLESVYAQGNTLPEKTFCTPILDFYNSILRTDVDLVEHIYDSIADKLDKIPDKRLTAGFVEYRIRRERFRAQQLGAVGGDTGTAVTRAFVDAWTPLAKAGYRLLVLLDTTELLRFEDDLVRERFGAPEPEASARRWLFDMVDNGADDDQKLPGVLFIVAGRKRESGRLYDEFRQRSGEGKAKAEGRFIELAGLDRVGVDEYFAELTKILESSEGANVAQQVREEINADLRAAFFQLTGGSPITLAIALQLFIDGYSAELPDLINEQLSQPNVQIPQAETRLQQALVAALANYQTFGAISIAVRYMPLARKGLTSERLQKLLEKLGANSPEVKFDDLFTDLSRQIFIKQLPDKSLVLHDKVADWAEAGLFSDEDAKTIYFALTNIYSQEITNLDQQINQLIPLADPAASIEEYENLPSPPNTSQQEDPVAKKRADELLAKRRDRRNRVIAQMSYALRSNPLEGYKIYYELAEEAFNVGRMDYETQIRTDFLGWWMYEQPVDHFKYRLQAEQVGLSVPLIEADFALRAVQRTYSSEAFEPSPARRSQAMVALIENIFASINNQTFVIPPFAKILLNVYADMGRGQLAASERSVEDVRRAFADHIQQLEVLTQQRKSELRQQDKIAHPESDLETFLLSSAQAFAYYELGFFESNHGNHGEAIDNYARSLWPYRALRFEVNQARSLNDKAYSSALIGDSHAAEVAVTDALKLRKRLGFSYSIALSYNTLGIVQMLSERPATALQNCGYALRIFQSLNHEFGQMLAQRAMSEAWRRDAQRLPENRLLYQRKLNEAIKASEVAKALADRLLTDQDPLLVYMLIEYSCAYRDMARFCWQYPDLCQRQMKDKEYASESEQALQRAIGIAQKIAGARNYLVDAVIDLAYLRYYQFLFVPEGDLFTALDKVELAATIALNEIPEVYRDPHNPKHIEQSGKLTGYWAYLGKVHGLRVLIEQQRLRLFTAQQVELQKREAQEDALLREAILTLYFSSLLEANVLNVRRSNQIVYEAFQAFSVTILERFYQEANQVAESLGLPSNKQFIMNEYLKDNFGLY